MGRADVNIGIKRFVFKILRKLFSIGKKRENIEIQFTGEKASDLIYDLLNENSPCMIARFGSKELNCVVNYLGLSKENIINYFRLLRGENIFFEFKKSNRYGMENNAGFFPANDENLNKFSQLMLACIPNVDILGSWVAEEVIVKDRLKAKIVALPDLEPYYHRNPWSRVLHGKNILVIHPFSKTIKSQYLKHYKLFKNKDVLPEFNLETITAVQSIAGNDSGYNDWFEALEAMKKEIMQKKYDIAIIGCGAYGFPLASFIKDQGKKAVHLGGATQILFGIKGRRWDEHHDFISKLYNEYWVRPSKEETPANSDTVEDGCYW